MSDRILITDTDPETLSRAVEAEWGRPLPWSRLDSRRFEDASVWLCAGAPPERPIRLAKLRWIHSGWAGVESWFGRPEWAKDVALTRTVGDLPQRMAQYVFGYLLTRVLDVPEAMRQMGERSWRRWVPDSLVGRNLLIVGMGMVGVEVAAVARAFQMHVSGVRRGSRGADGRVLDARGAEDLPALLAWAHVVVNLLPLTPETDSFWDARRFALMRPGAVFFNVARGATVDEKALLRGLDRGRPGMAVLDVFRDEPLPPEHPLRGRDDVWITPHVAGVSTVPAIARDFAENWRRFTAGEPLRYLVDRARGY
ncbi:MAG: D-2-hydroxyacid dehydrogenase [Candidatus Latescibacteria bacterium]|nr:D-2-hydroxyacid dehydrogenase [Candidatus Latescibacterota bacterium]